MVCLLTSRIEFMVNLKCASCGPFHPRFSMGGVVISGSDPKLDQRRVA